MRRKKSPKEVVELVLVVAKVAVLILTYLKNMPRWKRRRKRSV